MIYNNVNADIMNIMVYDMVFWLILSTSWPTFFFFIVLHFSFVIWK